MAKERRRITEIFDYGGVVYTLGTWLFDLFVLNCLWLFTSGAAVLALLAFLIGQTGFSAVGPVVGYGLIFLAFLFWCPATTALYYTLSKKWRKHESYMFKDYFRSYRENFRQAFLLGLIITLIGLLLWYNTYLIGQVPDMFGSFTHTILIFQYVVGVEILFAAIFAIALLARLRVTMKELIRDAFIMANKHLLTSIICGLIIAVAVFLVYYSLLWILLIVAPAVLCLVVALEKVFILL